MQHKIENRDLSTELVVDETSGQNTCIIIKDSLDEPGAEKIVSYHYLTSKDLSDLIGVLLHIQAKKRKGGKNV